MSFSNEGKELISQYQGHCGCPGCACEEMIKLRDQDQQCLIFTEKQLEDSVELQRPEGRLDDVESAMTQPLCCKSI